MNHLWIIVSGILIFIVLCVVLNNGKKEGLENMQQPSDYAVAMKLNVTKLQDSLLIPKYKKDYEASILNLDDYVQTLMLKVVMNISMDKNAMDEATVIKQLEILNTLEQSKVALNNVMKFVDSQK